MYILGAVTSGHDSSVALLKDGSLRYAINDKRLSRIKYRFENNSIRKSLEYVLSAEGIDINDVGLICCDTSHRYLEGQTPQSIFPDYNSPQNILQLNHHLGHGASAFFPSPFESAAVLTIDACGSISPITKDVSAWGQTAADIAFQGKGFIPAHEYKELEYYRPESESVSLLFAKRGEKIKELDNYFTESSLGFFYGHMGHYLFMEEGELMGLAGYGKQSDFCRYMEEVVLLGENGRVFINPDYLCFWDERAPKNPSVSMSYLTEKFYNTFGERRKLHQKINQRDMDFAYAVQKRLEDALIHIAKHLYKLTGSKNLCMAGGVALNSVANHKIIENTDFEKIWVQPAATDDGIAIGNALFGHYVISGLSEAKFGKMPHAYTGKNYTNDEVLEVLETFSNHKWVVNYIKDDADISHVYVKWREKGATAEEVRELSHNSDKRLFKGQIPIDQTGVEYWFETKR